MGLISPYTGDPLNVLVAAPVASPQLLATGARGPKGPKGDPFRVNAQGPTSELSLYANEESGFSFLAVDSGLLYLRNGETHGVWTDPVVFGGPQGIPGESGRGINGAVLSEGHLVLSYSDGQEDDLGNVQGPAGPTGPDGRNITAAAIDGSGHLILSLSDASVLDVGLIVGESGSWGSITGLLSNQADLAEALNNKVTVEAGKGLSTEDYSSAEKTKLAAIAAGATANATNAELRDRSTHTGTQAASTISDFAETVRATVLTGLSLADSTVVAATDTVLQAVGKLAARLATAFDRTNHTGSQAISTVTGLDAALAKALYAPVITEATTARVLALTDGAAYIRHTNASASTVTIPPQSSVTWLTDTEIHIRRAAAGNLTLTPGSGVTLNAPSGGTLVMTNAMSVTIKRVAADVWDVIGQTVPA